MPNRSCFPGCSRTSALLTSRDEGAPPGADLKIRLDREDFIAKSHPRGGSRRIYSTSTGPKGEFCRQNKDSMKRTKADPSSKDSALACRQCDQFMDRDSCHDAVCQFAMSLIWAALGIGCTVLGTVMVLILLA